MAKFLTLLVGLWLSVIQTVYGAVVDVSSSIKANDSFSLYFSVQELSHNISDSLKALDIDVLYDPVHTALTEFDFDDPVVASQLGLSPSEHKAASSVRKPAIIEDKISIEAGIHGERGMDREREVAVKPGRPLQSGLFQSQYPDKGFNHLSVEFSVLVSPARNSELLETLDPFMYLRNAQGEVLNDSVELVHSPSTLSLDADTNLPEPANLSILILAIALLVLRARFSFLQ
ncbi:hypothetical protein [Hahella ganghwensis]|uniref:hypothetical protein n=1 Tax=Hahella ganghwensis TaxID=286420 RepID=UPI0012F96F99|nr:hypothetical protein [Hahella ganghwensis]